MKVEVSPGDLVDKLTILEIKLERISDPAKWRNVAHECALLNEVYESECSGNSAIAALRAELKTINEELWLIEDDIREFERRKEFGPDFVELARQVYRDNDHRSLIKRRINEVLGSTVIEEKSYRPY
jgi:hypothetical protein